MRGMMRPEQWHTTMTVASLKCSSDWDAYQLLDDILHRLQTLFNVLFGDGPEQPPDKYYLQLINPPMAEILEFRRRGSGGDALAVALGCFTRDAHSAARY